MMRILTVLIGLALAPNLRAETFRHFATFVLDSHFKVTGGRVTPIPMKPIVFQVSTDGVHVHLTAEGDAEARTSFEIYRSDGVGRPRPGEDTLDVIPGIQAMSKTGGVLRHLRLTREAFTITTFPGVSDQTLITHAVAAPPNAAPPPPTAIPSSTPAPAKP
jgi:hypothetical protein